MEFLEAYNNFFYSFLAKNFFDFIFLILPYIWYWLPPLLAVILWRSFRLYTLIKYLNDIEWVLLEVKLPREISKSPLAMEMALGAFHQTSDITWYQKTLKGLGGVWFWLEIVSIDGDVHFFIRTPKFFRDLIESNIYSQYPEVEIYEVPDYVHLVDYGGKEAKHEIWGTEFRLTKPDPYPIKTYVDYGLDKDPKEEYKNDPITPIIEFLGQQKRGHQIWIQILIQAAKKRYITGRKWFLFTQKDDWKKEGQKLVEEIMKKSQKITSGEGADFSPFLLSPGERETAAAIERNIAKHGFDCGIRVLYAAPKKEFNPINFVGLIALFKQYSSQGLNGFRPNRSTNVDIPPLQDPFGVRVPRKKRAMLRAYRRRGYFYFPYGLRKPFVLSTEELATIYHFPGKVAETPTFSRIESRRGEPPANLPV